MDFESEADFIKAIEEVDIILDAADLISYDRDKYPVYLKVSVLLLAGKFENFIETVAAEYVEAINRLQLNSESIPSYLRMQHSFNLLKDIESLKHVHKRNLAEDKFREIGSLWAANQAFAELKIECKFSYGKHGDSEVIRLFSNIGIDNVFSQATVNLPKESLASEEPGLVEIDFKGMLNTVTHIRNNIIHQDASPSLTVDDVRSYRLSFSEFSKSLCRVLGAKLTAFTAPAQQELNNVPLS